MPRRRAIAVDLDNCLLNPAFYRRIQGVEPETTHLQNALTEQVKSINPEGKDEDKLGVEQLKQLVAARVNYLDKLNQEFIASNQPVITLFNGNKHLYASTDTYLFSNRQSLSDDMTNSNINKSGSGFHYYRLFSQHIGATPSFMLMSDIFTNSPYGSSLKVILGFLDAANDYDANKVKAARENNFKAPEWMHDRLKLIIAFAQMFDFAQRFPDDNGEKHDFFILDDKAQILDALHAYLKMYPGLIPSNIRLHLIRYEGSLNPDGTPIAKVIHYYTPLEGTGNLNIDYKAEVKNMAAVTIVKTVQSGTDLITPDCRPISNYEQAYVANFNCSEVNCIDHYRPGDIGSVAEPRPQKVNEISATSSKKESFMERMGSLAQMVVGKGKEKDPEKGKERDTEMGMSKYAQKAKSFPTQPQAATPTVLGKASSLPGVTPNPELNSDSDDYDVTALDPLMPAPPKSTSSSSSITHHSFFKASTKPTGMTTTAREASLLSKHRGVINKEPDKEGDNSPTPH